MPSGYTTEQAVTICVNDLTDGQSLALIDMISYRTILRDSPKELPEADRRTVFSDKSISDTIKEIKPKEVFERRLLLPAGQAVDPGLPEHGTSYRLVASVVPQPWVHPDQRKAAVKLRGVFGQPGP